MIVIMIPINTYIASVIQSATGKCSVVYVCMYVCMYVYVEGDPMITRMIA